VTQVDRTREHLIETYRKKAKHYDVTSRLYPVPGYPQRTQRLRAVQALGLRAGDTVIDMACGTGLNFPLIEDVIGPGGRIVGVDLTDAMLAHAQDRIATNGWRNISLVQADAADFAFPAEADAILSTYALSQVPECAEVIAHGAAALSAGGRWAVLDLKVPGNTPGWLAQLGTAMARPFASIDEWIMRRPWEVIRAAMQEELADVFWAELFFGTAFLAAGSRGRSVSYGHLQSARSGYRRREWDTRAGSRVIVVPSLARLFVSAVPHVDFLSQRVERVVSAGLDGTQWHAEGFGGLGRRCAAEVTLEQHLTVLGRQRP
jgi:ubiquinone/menaquinone biosynthesis C-methylase UbiE